VHCSSGQHSRLGVTSNQLTFVYLFIFIHVRFSPQPKHCVGAILPDLSTASPVSQDQTLITVFLLC